MAITHVSSLRNSLADEVAAAVDAGTTNAVAKFVFMTSGDAEVATCDMSNPAFGAASSGTITANAISDDTDATGGTIALFRILDLDDAEVFRGTVTEDGGGGDVIITSVDIGAGDTVTVDSFSYTAPA